MFLLVGLGNPGPEYSRNRHNIGFMAVAAIACVWRFSPWRKRFQGQTAEGMVEGTKVLALQPHTYMNLSGQAVGEAMRFHKLAPEQVVVLHDDLDLPPGKVRVKKGGGHGGHNGLRSLDSHIGKEYWRIRLGIGHPGDKSAVHGHVLHDFAKADQEWLEPLLEALAHGFPLVLAGEGEKLMTRLARQAPAGKSAGARRAPTDSCPPPSNVS